MASRAPYVYHSKDFGGGVLTAPEQELQANIASGDVAASLANYDRMVRRRRVPKAALCVALLELCAARAPGHTVQVLEAMGERHALEVDDYCRIVRQLILSRLDGTRLERFEEVALDSLNFSDDGMHNYFAHVAALVNLELHEVVCASALGGEQARLAARPAGGADGAGKSTDLDVGLITHGRQLDAAARLCKRAGTATTLFSIVLAGMGGREGAADDAEVAELAAAKVGLASAEAVGAARAELDGMASLNESQRRAASACMDQRLTLVQGPPGTGKTTVAVQVVRLWVSTLRIKPVLVSADSNVAVDNMGVALLAAGLNVVRLGRPDAICAELHARMPDALGGNEAIGEADVVLATCVGSGGDSISRHAFAAVLIDEVAQSTEPSTIIPVTRGCRQLVLVGDHKQLRPTVLSDDAARRGLSLSLFERLLGHGLAPHLLDTQYRMHPSLAEFASKAFYRGRLASGVGADARPRLAGFRWPSESTALALVPSSAAEEGSGSSSKRNPGEADAVVAIVAAVLGAGELSPSQLGVVTPYAAQVSLIRNRLFAVAGLPAAAARHIEVKSVDGFQGREKELIVFSAVRAGRGGSLGFVSDARRLNVMLTRARRGLIVVGEPRTLVRSRHWADWLQWVEMTGSVCAPPGWRMPPRPPDRHARREESSGSEDGEVDALGRTVRRQRSASAERTTLPPTASRAARRQKQREQRAAAAAAAAAEDEDEEAAWRRMVREAAGTDAAGTKRPRDDGEGGEADGAARHPRALTARGEPLLPNWYSAEDADGRTYYHNSATLEVCWEVPLLAPSRPPARAAAAELAAESGA